MSEAKCKCGKTRAGHWNDMWCGDPGSTEVFKPAEPVAVPQAPAEKIDYAAKDQKRGEELLTAFISWVNADDEDAITIGRNSGCYMRDEIERLRKAVAALEGKRA